MASPELDFSSVKPMANNPNTSPFLLAFFGAENGISWADVCSSPSWQQALGPWIRRYDRGEPFLLPRRMGGDLYWYAFATSSRQMRLLREALTAFVDKTYSDFDGIPYVGAPGDVIDASVAHTFGTNVFRMKVTEPERARFRERLEYMRNMWDACPSRQKAAKVPVGRLLRDFAMAVRAGDRGDATMLLEAIKRTGHLSAENLVFLQVELLGSMQYWSELYRLETFADLVVTTVPARVADHLASVVYHEEFLKFEVLRDWPSAIAHMRECLPLYGRLLSRVVSPASTLSLKALVLMLACDTCASSSRRAEVLEWAEKSGKLGSFGPLFDLICQASTEKIELNAKQAYEAYDFPRCIDLLTTSVLCVPDARMLVHAAAELLTLDACRIASARMANLEPSIQAEVLENPFIRAKWEIIKSFADTLCPAAVLPRSWGDWAKELSESEDFCRRAHTVAREASNEWDYSEYLFKPQLLTDLVSGLSRAGSLEAINALKLSLPYLLGFFLPDPSEPAPQFKELYGHLLMVLALDDDIGTHDLDAVFELCNIMMELGSTGVVMEAVEALFHRCSCAQNIGWMLDIVDLLVLHGKDADVINKGFFAQSILVLSAHDHRIPPEQWAFAQALAEELGPDYFKLPERRSAASGRVDIVTPFAGKIIGIYSLEERAVERAAQLVTSVYRVRKVETNCDKVATDRLRLLADKSDILVVVTRSAKHAATEAIQVVRGSSRPTLYPKGKGSSSILQALAEFAGEASAR
jgi:hypothetical protein